MSSGRIKGDRNRKELIRLKTLKSFVNHYTTEKTEVHDIYEMNPVFDIEKLTAEWFDLVAVCRQNGWI